MADVKIYAEMVDDCAKEQIQTLAALLAFSSSKIRIMPDVHAGAGCVIGFTADLGDKVIPNVVGVDIGCGMLTCELGKIGIDFEKLDRVIREHIPSGMNVRTQALPDVPDLEKLHCYDQLARRSWLERSVGTLGGGNHFIEIDRDDEDNMYLVIHTGSRNLGKQVADLYQKTAIAVMKGRDEYEAECERVKREYKLNGRQKEIQKTLNALKKAYEKSEADVPEALCYLEGNYREMYLHDMAFCQEFAMLNRKWIAKIICEKMKWEVKNRFTTVHNYIDMQTNIVRKGAVSARKGERLLIPMNMRDGSLICVGKGNDDWNQSAPHGAGRIMSRAQARRVLNMDDYAKSMDGIYTTSVAKETIDEAPMVYKPMEQIVSLIGETAEIERVIRPVYNFKAADD